MRNGPISLRLHAQVPKTMEKGPAGSAYFRKCLICCIFGGIPFIHQHPPAGQRTYWSMPHTPPSILAVEDNPETQLLLQHLLEPAFRIMVTDGIQNALDAARQDRFDILLLDINLSEEKTGIELLHMLRDHQNSPPTPAIALTAYAMPGDRESFIEAGFDAYVSKPFTRSDLMEVIESILSTA